MWYPGIYKNEVNSGIEFTKTSVIDKTNLTNITFLEDYTNYDLLLFEYNDTTDSKHYEFLIPSDMITEIFLYGHLMINRPGTNHHYRYAKTSNTVFTKNTSNSFELVDVYAVTCNKTINKTFIYKHNSASQTLVTITGTDILDNDILFFSTTGNGLETVTNGCYYSDRAIKEIINTVTYFNCRYNQGLNPLTIDNNSISSAYHFCVMGIKFT